MSDCIDKKTGNLLHLYELGMLSPQEAELFEKHLMRCEFCFGRVSEFEKYAAALRNNPGVRALAGEEEEAYDKQETLSGRLKTYLWPRKPLIFKPAMIYVLILLLIYPAWLGLRVAFESNDRIRPVQTIRLVSNRMPFQNTFDMSSGLDGIISFEFPPSRDDRRYLIIVTAGDGNELVRYDNFPDISGTGMNELLIPRELMKPGDYRLVVFDTEADSTIMVQRFNIIE